MTNNSKLIKYWRMKLKWKKKHSIKKKLRDRLKKITEREKWEKKKGLTSFTVHINIWNWKEKNRQKVFNQKKKKLER